MTSDDGGVSAVEDGGHVRRGYTPEDLHRLSLASGLDVQQIEYCSGVLSQKLTGISRVAQRHLPHLMVWALVLPFRWVPPALDKVATGLAKWPGYSITLVARKKNGAAGVVEGESEVRVSTSA